MFSRWVTMNHSFNIEHATQYGIEAAVLIENFIFWIAKNKANKTATKEIEIDGKKCKRTFTYNSVSAMAELFPYMNEKKMYRVLDSLIENKVLVRKYFNTNTYNRTSWYCFYDESHFLKMGNGFPENGKSISQKKEIDLPKMGNHDKDINKDINTIINKDKEEPLPKIQEIENSPKEAFTKYYNDLYSKDNKLADNIFEVEQLGLRLQYDTDLLDDLIYTKSNSAYWKAHPVKAKFLLKVLANENILKKPANSEQTKTKKEDYSWI